MPETSEDGPEDAERLAADADLLRDAWGRTLEDAQALEADFEAAGWEAILIDAGHTAPVSPDAGETDRWGFVHVIPGNKAEWFVDAFEAGAFPTYDVYRNEAAGRVFLVTAFTDSDAETAILIAGSYEQRFARPLETVAREEGEVYSHVQKLDKTHLGSFRHDDPGKFFPGFERRTDEETTDEEQ
jgi:hypothetical protein